MNATRVLALVAVPGCVLLATPVAHAAPLGGYTVTAQAAPVSVLLFEPVIPIPASPQAEVNLSYTTATMSSGSGRALASALWPGAAVANGLPQLAGNPDITYPVQTSASYPGGPKDAAQEIGTGNGMRAHADAATARAGTNLGAVAVPPATTPPLIPGLPIPGLPVPTTPPPPSKLPGIPLLVTVDNVSSTSAAGADATATARTTVSTVSLLGGLVQVGGLTVEATAASDGSHGTGTGRVTFGSVTVLGQRLSVESDGVHPPTLAGGPVALPGLPADPNALLGRLGIRIDQAAVARTGTGARADVAGHGPVFTVDTHVLRGALEPLLGLVRGLLPADLADRLAPVFSLAPKIAFTVGTAEAHANAAPAAAGVPGPGGTGGGAPANPPAAGGSQPVGGGVVPAAPGGGPSAPPALATPPEGIQPVSFGVSGLPGAVVLLALGCAGVAAWGLRSFNAALLGGAVCPDGHPSGVPDLRREWTGG
jgi:hypothetical protein